MRAHRFAALELPRARAVTEGLRCERANRTYVDHVAGQLRINRLTHERHDLGVLAAAAHAELHDSSDFLAETNATRAMNAAAHFFCTYERTKVFMEDDAFFFVVACLGLTVTNGQILQLAFTALIANRAIKRMVD